MSMTYKLSEIMPPAFFELHRRIRAGEVTEALCEGGRGGAKSSFISEEIELQMMRHPDTHAVVLRRKENTLRRTVYNQYIWAAGALGVGSKWKATVSPMDSHGYFSLSVSAIYERDLIDQGALVLLEVNPNFPRTFGDTQVHISEVDALVESDRPIPTKSLVPYTEVDKKIGAFVASLVEDGSTIQLGIGNIPNAVANELRSKRHLGIHTEMFTETMVDLIECGAVDNSQKGFMNGFSVCSFTMGSQRLYDFVHNNPSVLFKSSTFSNDPYTIARGPAPEGSLRRYRARRCPRAGNPSLQCIPPIRPQMQTAKRCCTQKLSPSWRGAPRSPLPETTPTTWSRSMVSPGCGD